MLGAYLSGVVVLGLLAGAPGPDVAVVSRFALTRGAGAARRAAVGVALGLAAWGGLTVVGLAAVLAASAGVYSMLRLAGAAYLVVLGVAALWRSLPSSRQAALAASPHSPARPLRAGLLTNLLNPKIAVFYTAVLPSLVPRGEPAGPWLAALVAAHIALSLTWLTAYALLFSHSRAWLGGARATRWLDRATGVVLVGLGLRVAFEP